MRRIRTNTGAPEGAPSNYGVKACDDLALIGGPAATHSCNPSERSNRRHVMKRLHHYTAIFLLSCASIQARAQNSTLSTADASSALTASTLQVTCATVSIAL
jgi:hypothetical protein